ncbi:MAG: cardiolipin synthase ClsB [Ideonella sp.]|nr:cardiolipin synthase ClsB [Ideonella sp.]MCC7455528.1 cardiolipin synthase ClsB [Nitrospira sp.]
MTTDGAEPARTLLPVAAAWARRGAPEFSGGHRVRLLQGGDELFPAMCSAIAGARHEVWLATYIFHDDAAGESIAQALRDAGRRGVRVQVVVDGFGSKATMARLRQWLPEPDVELSVFRPVDRWWSLLQPGQLRRLHQKLCAIDRDIGFVGGINIIDDRLDLRHGLSDAPRLDFAIEVRGPIAEQVALTARAVWTRAALGADWRDEVVSLARSAQPVARARRVLQRLRMVPRPQVEPPVGPLQPVVAAFVVRDNLRQRRSIERAYIEAVLRAGERVDLVTPYFYPGRLFRRALTRAAERGVRVRLLLQGKIDYRFAALAAHVLYDELRSRGIEIYEYMPAFLHAKVALVDGQWATVGSSNIDPLSLLLNLEANVIVQDAQFSRELSQRFDAAVAASREVTDTSRGGGWRPVVLRGFVAWCANWFLRMAGINSRY